MITLKVHNEDFRRKLRKTIHDRLERGKNVVQVTQNEAVKYAKSYTGETKPALTATGKKTGTERNLHPGGWGDITNNLRDSIQAGKIVVTQDTIKGTFGVGAETDVDLEYSEILDQRDGIDVLGGADVVAKEALAKHGKEIVR